MMSDERNARELCMKAERNNKLSCINEIIRTIHLKLYSQLTRLTK